MFGYLVFAFIFLVCVGIFIGYIIKNKTAYKSASQPLEENYDLKAIDISDIDLMEDGTGFEHGVKPIVLFFMRLRRTIKRKNMQSQ